jgi:hypothetical protein
LCGCAIALERDSRTRTTLLLYFIIATVADLFKRLPGGVANAVDLDRSSEMEGLTADRTCDGLLTLYREKIVNEMRSLRVNKGDVEMNVYRS